MFKLVVLSALLAVASAKPSAYFAHPAWYAPAAVSHQSRVDYHSAPLVYSAPVHTAWAAPWAAPLGLAPHTPATILTPHGVPLETADVVAAKAVHFQAHALANHGHYIKKRSVPLAYSILAPSAVSHQSRVDIHSSPVITYAAPLLSHYAPYPAHYSYVSPYAAHGLWAPKAYGVHPW